MKKRELSLAAGVTLIALVTGSAARAEPAPTPNPDNAAIAVYIETIPTASGSRAVGVGTKQRTPLPAATRSRLAAEGGADATLLEQLATAATYGAPQKTVTTASPKSPPTKKPQRIKRTSVPELPAAPQPASEDVGLLRWWLLAGAMVLSGIAAAGRRYTRA